MTLKEHGIAIDTALQGEYNEWVERVKELNDVIAKQEEILRSDEAQGDRSENAVFQTAVDTKQEALYMKSTLESNIAKFEMSFQDYKTSDHAPASFIKEGTVVRFIIMDNNREFVVKLVPKQSAAPRKGAVSSTSPLGRALLNKRAGDIVECQTERGVWSYKIQEVY